MSKRHQKRVEHELKDLINLRDNANKCGECDATFPTWASVNLGIFLCGRCASMHRKLGDEVTVVKSLTHDRWDDSDLESISSMGNKRAKRLWNPKGEPFPFDDDDKDLVFMFFVKKYKRGDFRYDEIAAADYNLGHGHRGGNENGHRSRGSSLPRSSSYSSSGNVPTLSHRDIPEMQRLKYRKQEPKLKSLGYNNTDDNYEALVLAKGDVTLAADILSKSAFDDSNEKKPPLPRRPGSSSAPSSQPQPQSSGDWWSSQSTSANTPTGVGALGVAGVTATTSATSLPVDANGLIEAPQQYLDPATGIIYVDLVHQQQYELQQQQLSLQQTGVFGTAFQQQPQQTGLDKSSLMSLYSQPTAQAPQQPVNPQQTAFSTFSGFPQQTGQQLYGQQQFAQPMGQQFTNAQFQGNQFTGFPQQQQQQQQFQGGYQF